MQSIVHLGHTPCPNDTFLFGALTQGIVAPPQGQLQVYMEDIEQLNQWALLHKLDISKVSCPAYFATQKYYRPLRVGAAMGIGVGPILLGLSGYNHKNTHNHIILFPGRWTTAYLLFRLRFPDSPVKNHQFVPYYDILPMLIAGKAQAGVIIHESRFTYPKELFPFVVDLGVWWEKKCHLPLPLGVLVVRQDWETGLVEAWEERLQQSLAIARLQRPAKVLELVRHHAIDRDPLVQERHIATYVNDMTYDYGNLGEKSLHMLWQLAKQAGVLHAE